MNVLRSRDASNRFTMPESLFWLLFESIEKCTSVRQEFKKHLLKFKNRGLTGQEFSRRV